MTILLAIYWFAFAIGLVYVMLAGAIGALSHGIHLGAGHDGAALDSSGSGSGELHSADMHGSSLDSAHGELDHALGAEQDNAQDGTAAHTPHVAAGPSGQFADYHPLSPLSLMGMLCGFGAGGLIAAHFRLGLLSLGPALLGALAMAALLWLVIGKLLYSLQGSSEAHVEDMVGLEAEVITPVEFEMSGEIAYVLGGTRYTAPARMLKPGRIPQHGKVRIRRVQGNLVYVEEQRKLLD